VASSFFDSGSHCHFHVWDASLASNHHACSTSPSISYPSTFSPYHTTHILDIMNAPLHCNDLKCRTPCSEQAVVTTCSHVFCPSCANRLGLTESSGRVCPACSTQLLQPDDAVLASLNPTEDYKTSILSGLSPTVIMECAGRGLAFWAYQVVQEMWVGCSHGRCQPRTDAPSSTALTRNTSPGV
jgi:hypothetical protein